MGIRAVLKKLTSIEPVWWLNAAVAASAVGLYLGFARHYAPIHSPEIAWWVLALAVVLSERFPVELEFRRSSQSFALSAVPITQAVVFANATHTFEALT